MKRFAQLYDKIDSTTSTNDKVDAMVEYFQSASKADAAWALYYLTGRRLKRFISSKSLRDWTLELTGVKEWLYAECYSSVGDTAECCSLLLDSQHDRERIIEDEISLDQWMTEKIKPLAKMDELEQKHFVVSWWSSLDRHGIFVLNKLLTGSFRVGVSQSLVARALAKVSGLENAEIAHRLMGTWEPTPEWFEQLTSPGTATHALSTPYPFYLASPIEKDVVELGAVSEWQAEWKWDGIRAQVIRRGKEVFIWSRGEELITDRFPEIAQAALTLPDGTVLDGEIMAMRGNIVLPFSVLQKRIGRKTLSKAILTEAPAALMIYDLIELGGKDLRLEPMSERRAQLENLITGKAAAFHLSPTIRFASWDELTEHRKGSRERAVEGIMLKRRSSPYQAGRKRGDWWKWKIDPLTIDAVLIYAQAGSGRRANLFTDYTFALWEKDKLTPIAKAYSGLSDEEIDKLDHWIRRNTQDKFGPVRSVTPFHVFELAFEGINVSTRHKSGVAVRFPRILRWRHDKKIADADQLDTLKKMAAEGMPEGTNASGTSPQYDLARDPAFEKA